MSTSLSLPALPFLFNHLTSVKFLETTGIARIMGKTLILEFHPKDGFLGWLEAEAKTVSIPLAILESAILQQGWLRSYLVFQVKSRSGLKAPTAEPPMQFHLTLAQPDQALAKHWIAFLQKQLAVSA